MVIREEIKINAPLQVVWELFSCFDDWGKWNSVCRGCCYVTGNEMSAGACVSFVISPFNLPLRISPRIVRCTPGREVVWEGERLGIHARHTFAFREEEDKVILLSVEQFRGPMIALSRLVLLPSRLHRLTRQLLVSIKREAEARHKAATTQG